MICPQCAADNPVEARYCSQCGARLAADAPDRDQTPAQPDLPLAEADRPLRAGQLLDGRYEIVRSLGAGPRGAVYLARDLNLQAQEIALKVFRPEITSDPELDQALTRGVIAWQGLIHPGVVKVYDLRRSEGRRFLTEEYVPGESLDRLLAQRPEGRLPLPEACRVGIGLLDVLVRAHPQTPHLGLTPGNVLVVGRFPEISIKLTDFAVAGRLEAARAGGEETRPAGPPADIRAAGAIVYRLVTGQAPADPVAPPSQVIAGLPPALDQVLARALDNDPAARFEDAARFRRALVTVAKEAIEAELNQRRRAEESRAAGAGPEPEPDRTPAESGPDQAKAEDAPAEIPAPRAEPEAPVPEEAPPRQEKIPRRPEPRPWARIARRIVLAAMAALLVAAAVAGYLVWRDYSTRQNVKQWTAQAAAAWQQGRFRTARDLYARLARARPEDQVVRRRLKASQAKIEALSRRAAPWVAKAKTARGQKQLARAGDEARRALVVDPHNPEAIRLRAALTADQQKVKAWLATAGTAWRQKKYQAAGRLYRQVIGLSSEHPLAARRLARIQDEIKARQARLAGLAARAALALRRMDLDAAETASRGLLQLDPGHKPARAALARIAELRRSFAGWADRIVQKWRKGQYVAAQKILLQTLALSPAPPPAKARARPAPPDRRDSRQKVAAELAAGRRALTARQWSAARGHFRRVLTLDRANAEAKKALALIQARAKQIAAAAAQAESALAHKDPALMAAALGRFKNIDPAHPAVARLESALDAAIKSLLDRARQALDQRRPDRAKKLTDQALRLRPTDRRAVALHKRIEAVRVKVSDLVRRIEAAQKRKDWTRADDLIKQAAALDAGNARLDELARQGRAVLARIEPLVDQARRAEAQGDLAAAQEAYARVAALAPGDQAIAAARKRLKGRLASRITAGLKKTARLIKAEKWAAAEKAASAVIKLDPKAAAAHAYRAAARLEQEKFKGALADYDQALKLGLPPSRRAGVLYERCFVLFRLARLRPALAACTRAIRLAPKRAAYYRARAAIYRRLGRKTQAQRDLAAFKRLNRGR